jgi:hypothetical protein
VRLGFCAVAALTGCLGAPVRAQSPPRTGIVTNRVQVPGDRQRMQIILERREGDDWRAVDPGLVFAQNDHIRFRFEADFAGYLYVMNQSTSGQYDTLFPRQDTGEDNKIEAHKEYLIPATQGSFRITGPPGYDILYWMVTPLPLGAPPKYVPLPPPPKPGPVPPRLVPRCDDTLFKARGECIDSSAGARAISREAELPENLKDVPAEHSRELVFVGGKNLSVVVSPRSSSGPMIYEFRLAHK